MTEALRAWLAAFPSGDVKESLAELEAQRARIEAEIAELQKIMNAISARNGEPAATAVVTTNGHSNGTRPTGMDAVEAVLREQPRTWTRRDLYRELAERGWLTEGEAGRKTLGSILYRMVRADRVERVSEGRYRLPQTHAQEVLAA